MAILMSFILKLVMTENILLLISTTFFDIAVYALILLVFFELKQWIGKYLSRLIFYFLFVFNTLITFFGSYYVQELVTKNYSLYHLDFSLMGYFFENLLPVHVLISMIVGFLVIVSIAYYVKPGSIIINNKKPFMFYSLSIIILVLILVPFSFSGNFGSVYVNTVKETFTFGESIPILDYEIDDLQMVQFDKALDIESINLKDLNLKYDKILVFMLEETIFDAMEDIVNDVPDE
ncbi:MAG: hypothetical protein GW914_04055, partial [Candidatus Aenigmarchaeota archaeon]|nr:hypothetical protein [Candidatus Aenigmarchaeota archaeon]